MAHNSPDIKEPRANDRGERVETTKPQQASEPNVSEFLKEKDIQSVRKAPTQKTLEEYSAFLETTYGLKAYGDWARSELQKKGYQGAHLEQMIKYLQNRYKPVFEEKKAEAVVWMKERINDLKEKTGETIDVGDRQKKVADALKGKVQKEANLFTEHANKHERIDTVQGEITTFLNEKKFDKAANWIQDDFVDALGDDYLDPALNEDKVSSDDRDAFLKGMKAKVEFDVRSVDAKTEDEKRAALEKIMADLQASYESMAAGDGLIGADDLLRLKNEAVPYQDLMEAFRTGKTDAEMIKGLETKRIVQPQNWVKSVVEFSNSVLTTIENGGYDKQAFIDAVQTLKGDGKKLTFGQAKDLFQDELKTRMKADVAGTLKWGRGVFEKVFKDTPEMEAMESIPEPLRPRVELERKLLMESVTNPRDNQDDLAVLEFMRKEGPERILLLSNEGRRSSLIQSIRDIEKREDDEKIQKAVSIYSDPQKVEAPGEAGKPNGTDRAARSMALILIAKEADRVVSNYGYQKELTETTANENTAALDTRFRDTRKRYPLRYTHTWAEAGLSGKNALMAVVQLWGLITLAVNLKSTGKKSLTNPYVWLGAAALGAPALHKYSPEAMGYLKEDQGGQERIAAKVKFDTLAWRVGRQNLIRFMSDPNEWRAMESISPKDDDERKSKVAEVLKTASARPGKSVLVKKDLEPAMESGPLDMLAQSQDGWRERTRYLFYQTFMTNKRPPLGQLKAFAEEWSK